VGEEILILEIEGNSHQEYCGDGDGGQQDYGGIEFEQRLGATFGRHRGFPFSLRGLCVASRVMR
jgi:hypothetical protein